jgi:MFS family permease
VANKLLLTLMCSVVAMTILDLSIVIVALASIQADLGASAADLQWVVVVYGLLLAGLLILGGRGGDILGHRRVLLAGICLLAGASFLAGISGSLPVLLIGRAGQGIGAAMATPNALAILTRAFAEGPERNRALGIFGAARGTAAVAGTVIGGLLVEGPGWQWAFFLNVPFGLAIAALIALGVPADEPRAKPASVDLAGAAALTVGLMAIVLALHESIDGVLAAATLVPLALGLGLLAGFSRIEGRAAEPLIPPVLLRRPSLAFANLAAALLLAAFLGVIYQVTLFVQEVLGYSPLTAGASMLPVAVSSVLVSARAAPPLIARLGAAATIAIGASGLGLGSLLLVRASGDPYYLVELLPAYCLIGAGVGLGQVAVQIAAFAGVGHGEAGIAGGAIETASEMGGALGLATVVAVALGAGGDATGAFHHGVLAASALAGAGALVAGLLLRRTEPDRVPLRQL